MFRCPSCAKVNKLPLNENYVIISNQDMTVYSLMGPKIEEPLFVKSIQQAIEHLESIGEKVLDQVTCSDCQGQHSLEDWQKAFIQPMDFFDAENLCACGEELWMEKVPGTNVYALTSDSCGWIKRRDVVSGSSSPTSR